MEKKGESQRFDLDKIVKTS